MQSKKGFTGTMGGWSARNPWKAIAAWVAFVVAAVVIGTAVGTNQLKPADSGAGDSGTAAKILDKAGFGTNPTEQVIVSSKRVTAADPQFRAVVADVMTRLKATDNVTAIRSPYEQQTISADGHSALVTFEVPGTQQTVGNKVAPALATTKAAAAAHPGFTIGEAGEASFQKAYNDTQGKDFQRAETLSLPLTLLILVFAFGGLVLAHPGAARDERRRRRRRPDRDLEPPAARHRRDAVRDPADRPRRRRRLLDLLPRA